MVSSPLLFVVSMSAVVGGVCAAVIVSGLRVRYGLCLRWPKTLFAYGAAIVTRLQHTASRPSYRHARLPPTPDSAAGGHSQRLSRVASAATAWARSASWHGERQMVRGEEGDVSELAEADDLAPATLHAASEVPAVMPVGAASASRDDELADLRREIVAAEERMHAAAEREEYDEACKEQEVIQAMEDRAEALERRRAHAC